MAERYTLGRWSCAYSVTPVEHPLSLQQLATIIQEVKGHETGWPVWLSLGNRPGMRPRVVDDVLECWLYETEDGDYWRADPHGYMFLARKLQEDTREIPGVAPGRYFDLTLPVWRTGECLLHASRFASRLGADTVELSMTWSGLKDRELGSIASRERILMPGRLCHDDTVTTSTSTDASAITDTLPELVRELVAPLFARFDLFEPSTELYLTELARMRRGV
jgi:hypothetical protein